MGKVKVLKLIDGETDYKICKHHHKNNGGKGCENCPYYLREYGKCINEVKNDIEEHETKTYVDIDTLEVVDI